MFDPSERESRFRTMYVAHYSAMSAFAVRRLASPDDVADTVAEVFTVAWRRLETIPDPPEDRLWLYGVARRVVADNHRGSTRRQNLLNRLTSQRVGVAPHASAPDAIHEHVLESIGVLRPVDREALLLVAWDGLSHAEAAQVLGCSVNAIGIRVHRAKARLRAVLAACEPSTPKLTRD